MHIKTERLQLPYTIRTSEFKMKLEPIINIPTGEVLAFEVLSRAKDVTLNNELFFKFLTTDELLQLLQRQMERFQKLHEQDENYFSSMFVNVPVEFIYDEKIIYELYPFFHKFKINFEVECNSGIFFRDRILWERSSKLLSKGINVWLDDVSEDEFTSAEELINNKVIYGVKLDKYSFWDSYENNANLYGIIGGIRDKMIVEGIETIDHLVYAKNQSVIFGQGYLWK